MMRIMRETKQRKAILEALCSVHTHPTADELYFMVRKKIPNISLGTVYRNLRLLKETGQILEFEEEGKKRFDGFMKPHLHLICKNCNRLVDLDIPIKIDYDKKKLQKLGLKIDAEIIRFYGYCSNCCRTTSL